MVRVSIQCRCVVLETHGVGILVQLCLDSRIEGSFSLLAAIVNLAENLGVFPFVLIFSLRSWILLETIILVCQFRFFPF